MAQRRPRFFFVAHRVAFDPRLPLFAAKPTAGDVLRQIWVLACQEYWALHIHGYSPKLYRLRGLRSALFVSFFLPAWSC